MTLSAVGTLARQHDPDRFLCALFAPAASREALFTLIAFNHELARAREAATNPIAALIRLQWWREVVDNAAAGRPARAHAVAGPVAAAVATGALESADLLALADAREIEADPEGIATRAGFQEYLRGTAGGVAAAMGRVLGASGSLDAVREAGTLYGLAGVLRSMPALAGAGRCLLPAEVLAAHGTEAAAVIADPGCVGARAAVTALAREGHLRVATARMALRGLPRGAVAAALPLVLAERDLRRLAAGRIVPERRGVADRLAVAVAGWRG